MFSFVFNERTYPACDVTICAELTIYFLQIFANNLKTKILTFVMLKLVGRTSFRYISGGNLMICYSHFYGRGGGGRASEGMFPRSK